MASKDTEESMASKDTEEVWILIWSYLDFIIVQNICMLLCVKILGENDKKFEIVMGNEIPTEIFL
jgi:hypothetical protein